VPTYQFVWKRCVAKYQLDLPAGSSSAQGAPHNLAFFCSFSRVGSGSIYHKKVAEESQSRYSGYTATSNGVLARPALRPRIFTLARKSGGLWFIIVAAVGASPLG